MEKQNIKTKKNRTSSSATKKYHENNYERIGLVVQMGQRDIIKAHAQQYQEQAGEKPTAGNPVSKGYSPKGSVNAFINRAIAETMERDKAKAGE